MTVASEISRLQTAKSNIKSSVASKGVTIPASASLDEYSGYIDQIKCVDYSSGTTAYGLKATTGLSGYKNGGLELCYSEINDDGTVFGILPNRGWMSSSDCDYVDMKFLTKKLGCMPQWDSVSCRIGGTNSLCNKFWIYVHKTNKDCYLINRAYCESYTGSGSSWRCCQYYYRVGIDFSAACMSCIGIGCRCCTGSCCGGCDYDVNNPGSNYQYIGKSFDCIKACRGNKPAGLLCTTIESTDNNNYSGAAVFR